MPGFTTHYLFGADLYQRLTSERLRKNLKQNHAAFGLGLQGPDLFFYYLPVYLVSPENPGALAHSTNTGAFFSSLLESRRLFAGNKRCLNIADAYITGFIGHYTLDCALHPYVYAFTGYEPEHPQTNLQYFGRHSYFETEIDKELLKQKKNLSPSRFRQNATIRLTPAQRRVIHRMLAYAYRTAYPDYKASRRLPGSAPEWMQLGTCFFRDPSGRKKVILRFFERLLIGRAFISPMIASDKYCFVKDPLNLRHRNWIHPWTKETENTSFPELYQNALHQYCIRVKNYYRLRNSGFPLSQLQAFLQEYGNRSFLSGQPCGREFPTNEKNLLSGLK